MTNNTGGKTIEFYQALYPGIQVRERIWGFILEYRDHVLGLIEWWFDIGDNSIEKFMDKRKAAFTPKELKWFDMNDITLGFANNNQNVEDWIYDE